MLTAIDTFLNSLTTGQLLFAYFWLLAFPLLGFGWAIEQLLLKLNRNNNDDWRKL